VSGGRWWPAALILVLAVTVVANVALYWKANHDPSFAVEPNYYQRAVEWDSTVARRARSAALGWTMAVRLTPPEQGGSTLLVDLHTQDGAALDSADVRAEASHNARGGEVFRLRLAPTGPGRYAARIPSAARGLWRVDLAAVRGAEVFSERVTIDNGALPAP
jgi:nitrogen fixation protein FixH